MNKFIVFLLVAASLFVSFGLGKTAIADKNQVALNPTPTPRTSKRKAEIISFRLDRNEVLIPCPPIPEGLNPEIADSPIYNDNGLVNVETVVNSQIKNLTYHYTVSGGRIIGQGAKVVWDLKGARPGNYSISVQIGDGTAIFDRGVSETVQLSEPCCYMCVTCPTVAVLGGGKIKAGETVSFEAHASGGAGDLTYEWTVSQGEIIEGKGTSKITVATSSGMTGEVKATVEISGMNLCQPCTPTASETATIEK